MTLASGLDADVGDEEDLMRFLAYSRHYSATVVDESVFLPSPKDRETSVFRFGREELAPVWELGLAVVHGNGRKLHGAAFIKAREARVAGLTAVASEPPPRHAALRGWPWPEDQDLRKAQQKEVALILAKAAAAPVLYTTSEPT